MNQELARQLTAHSLLVVDVCAVTILLIYLFGEMRESGWMSRLRNQGAVAFLTYFTGMLIVRVMGSLRIWGEAHDQQAMINGVEGRFAISLIGTSIALVGALCFVRVFSPIRLRRVGWLISAGLVLFVMWLTWYLYPAWKLVDMPNGVWWSALNVSFLGASPVLTRSISCQRLA